MMKNKLIVVGFTGAYRCYLNVTHEEAVKRYTLSEGVAPAEVNEIEFDDEFRAYDIYNSL